MEYLLVVMVWSAQTAEPELITHQTIYSREECQTMRRIFERQASTTVRVKTECIGLPKNGWF